MQGTTDRALPAWRGFSLRLEPRLEVPRWLPYAVPILSLGIALVLGMVPMLMQGINPLAGYRDMVMLAFGSAYAISETIMKAIPLMLAGLGVAVAFRMLVWNIGAEGQLYMGAFLSCLVAYTWPDAPAWILLPAMIAAGFLGGALWGAIPGALKAFLGVNEIITSLMLNYIAIQWINYLVVGPWQDPTSLGFPRTTRLSASATLPTITTAWYLPTLAFLIVGGVVAAYWIVRRLRDRRERLKLALGALLVGALSLGAIYFLDGRRVHLGFVLSLLAAAVLAVLLGRTRWGYEVRVIGESARAARYAGMSLTRNIVLVMMISGGMAGLAGMSEISGNLHLIKRMFSPGYGYTAIIVAWLAKLNPWGVIVVSLLLGALYRGSDAIPGAPKALGMMLQAVIFFVLIGGEVLIRYRIRLERRA
ncbi:MAG: ABC transporter permease [Chloroflexi bacterium B3_Chlor]|nr:MAG: ABC transporter permease [Chloroflexi bacterium B3_Chlor]